MRLAVVTGAAGGIGRWIARGLAQSGYDLILVGRTGGNLAATRDWLLSDMPGTAITCETVDLSSLAQTRLLGDRLVQEGRAVDVLVNNAGIFMPRREETPEGHELVLAVNHLAPFMLTRALLPALRRAAAAHGQARIVNIGSSTSDRARIYPDDLEGRRRWGLVHTYGQSKLALLIATRGWAEQLRGSRVTANVVHPGAVATGLVRARGPIGLAWAAMAPFLLTEAQGADSPLHVATSPDFAGISGAYVKKRRVMTPNRRALDQALAAQVWNATEALTGP